MTASTFGLFSCPTRGCPSLGRSDRKPCSPCRQDVREGKPAGTATRANGRPS